jgi:hypothetical protein
MRGYSRVNGPVSRSATAFNFCIQGRIRLRRHLVIGSQGRWPLPGGDAACPTAEGATITRRGAAADRGAAIAPRRIEVGLLVRDRALALSISSHFRGLIDRRLLNPLPMV